MLKYKIVLLPLCPSTKTRNHIQGVEEKLHGFLTLALLGDEWSALRSSRFTHEAELSVLIG